MRVAELVMAIVMAVFSLAIMIKAAELPVGWIPQSGPGGGVSFIREGHKLRKLYGVAPSSLPEWRRRMRAAAGDVMVNIPGARMSADSKYREVDLAIDWNEEVHLSLEEADRAVAMLREDGEWKIDTPLVGYQRW